MFKSDPNPCGAFLNDELAKVTPSFEITNNDGNDYTTSNSNLLLTGKAPVDVKFIHLNGTNANISWTTVTNWSISLVLTNGLNTNSVAGFDRFNNAVSGATDRIVINYQP